MIRVNLLAPERPTGKKKARAVSVAPGAVQVYLFLALFVGGALVVCAALWWYESTSRHWLRHGRREDPEVLARRLADLAWAGLRSVHR